MGSISAMRSMDRVLSMHGDELQKEGALAETGGAFVYLGVELENDVHGIKLIHSFRRAEVDGNAAAGGLGYPAAQPAADALEAGAAALEKVAELLEDPDGHWDRTDDGDGKHAAAVRNAVADFRQLVRFIRGGDDVMEEPGAEVTELEGETLDIGALAERFPDCEVAW